MKKRVMTTKIAGNRTIFLVPASQRNAELVRRGLDHADHAVLFPNPQLAIAAGNFRAVLVDNGELESIKTIAVFIDNANERRVKAFH
jgi:hypothetical protein